MRTLLSILLSLYFASCSDNSKIDKQQELGETTVEPNEKLNKKDSLFNIARIDERSQRVFVVIDSNILTDIKKIRTIIKQVDNKYSFRNDLNISFVTAFKYAGYKTDLEETKGISFYEFYLNYLGEYNKATKIFWTYPALADRKVKYIID
jgi:hypothetical protein